MGETHVARLPTAVYGAVLLMAAVAYLVLQGAIVAHQGEGSRLREAVGRDVKGKLSTGLYVAAILIAFARPSVSVALYVLVALLWLVPDRRIESRVAR
jgi:uncharacterized membrane protein